MDPQSPPSTSFEAPLNHPQGDMIPLVPNAPEAAPGTPEQIAQPQMPPSTQPATTSDQGQPSGAAAVLMSASSMPAPAQPIHPSAPAVADDLDLIEKEWVEKAKAIVAQTRTDPYAQNKEMNFFKADYMKKRYNKDIKLDGV